MPQVVRFGRKKKPSQNFIITVLVIEIILYLKFFFFLSKLLLNTGEPKETKLNKAANVILIYLGINFTHINLYIYISVLFYIL